MKKIFFILIIFIFSTTTFAHSPLIYIEPKDKEILSVSPKKIVIKFKSRTKIFKITLNKEISENKKSLFGNIISKSNSKKIIITNDFEIKNSSKHTIN